MSMEGRTVAAMGGRGRGGDKGRYHPPGHKPARTKPGLDVLRAPLPQPKLEAWVSGREGVGSILLGG